MHLPLEEPAPDFGRLRSAIMRDGIPDRLPAMELFCDLEIMCAVLGKSTDEFAPLDYIRFQEVMGYDYLNAEAKLGREVFTQHEVGEANPESLASQRIFQDEHNGPIQGWEDLERFEWPTVESSDLSQYDLYAANLPSGMQIIAWVGGYFENVSWSTGIESFCYKLADDRPFVEKLFEKWGEYAIEISRAAMDKPGVAAYWLSDDLGFNSGPFMSPEDNRRFVMPVYSELGRMCRSRGIPFILHSCGKLDALMEDFIDCGVDCLHSLPPNLYDLAELKARWGESLSFAGNIDLNILALESEKSTREAVRAVRSVYEASPRGGIVLSSANTVANYCKVDNYFAMMSELLSPNSNG